MTWTRLSDDFTDRPDLLSVSRSARLLHVEALVYCNRHLTDGGLPRAALTRISDAEDADADAEQLVAAGLWASRPNGWQVEWADQEPSAEVRARQQNRAAIQKRYRERKAKHAQGDHSMCDPRHCAGPVTGNATSHKTHSRPDPARPDPKESGRDLGVVRRCSEGKVIAEDGTCCVEHRLEEVVIDEPSDARRLA